MNEQSVIYAAGDNPDMLRAFQEAQDTFKYFWRELSWEYRRIVPALDLACIKIAFLEETATPGKPIVEYMWVSEINFDGEMIHGMLINTPDKLRNVQNGDHITASLNRLCDWMFALDGKTYGGFTVQLLRAGMSEEERREHDEAWGLDFGDYNDIQVVRGQKETPAHLTEHPMSLNMKDSFLGFLKENPDEVNAKDEAGHTILHRETIAGNRSMVEALLSSGVDTSAQTNSGKTALDYAQQLSWEHIIPLLQR
ncbi:MAG TPA: DUF2314 domain-containing protein [Chitinophaga sp.]|uniref:DUF2314 domain-containing protein n=1 Tax=Chitinophaga sp. TaxID=1869181 RepID=UPI002CF7811A|nr:DUF2314 domain-containing protein [Chitinophaga sp.]HVI45063.1 DUF2314 domain-containing protein [Chitinophaga sp.]